METKMTSVHIQRNLYDLAKLHKINITETLNEALEKKLETYETLQKKKEKLEKEVKELGELIEKQRVSKELEVVVNELRDVKDSFKARELATKHVDTYKLTVRELCKMAGYE